MTDELEWLRRAITALGADGMASVFGVSVHRSRLGSISLPSTHNPYICLLVDGSLTLHTRDDVRHLAPRDFFISQVDIPATAYESNNDGALVLIVEFSVDEVISVLLDFDADGLPGADTAAMGHQADVSLLQSLTRLLGAVEERDNAAFMAKHLRREVIFRLMTGPAGRQFIGSVTNLRAATEMYYVNSWIKHNYRQAFTVDDLARQSDMSPSAFHRKFKDAVQMGPLQCQKQLRLTEARRLLLDGTATVSDAAVQVGYESVSQFIRDYRRTFGRSPRQDVDLLQQRLREMAQRDKPSP